MMVDSRKMMLKDLYKYSFYILYKTNCFSSSWGADWRAGGLLMVLTFFLFTSMFLYFGVLFTYEYPMDNIILYMIVFGIIFNIINFRTFFSNNNWRSIIAKYDKWPDKKNLIRGGIVYAFLICVFANFLISVWFYQSLILGN